MLEARAGSELGTVGGTPGTQGTLFLGLLFPPGWKQMKGCSRWAGLPRIPPWKASTASGSRGPLPVSPCAILLPAPLHTEAGLTTMPRDLWEQPSTHGASHRMVFLREGWAAEAWTRKSEMFHAGSYLPKGGAWAPRLVPALP